MLAGFPERDAPPCYCQRNGLGLIFHDTLDGSIRPTPHLVNTPPFGAQIGYMMQPGAFMGGNMMMMGGGGGYHTTQQGAWGGGGVVRSEATAAVRGGRGQSRYRPY